MLVAARRSLYKTPKTQVTIARCKVRICLFWGFSGIGKLIRAHLDFGTDTVFEF